MSLVAYGKRFAYKQGKRAVAAKYGQQAADAYKYLFSSKSKAQAQASPAAILAKTPLRSYLDKRYARKCGVEVHQRAGVISYTITSTLSNVNVITAAIAQGDGDAERVGSSLEIKSYTAKILFRAGALASDTTFVRMFLVKTGKTEGTNPSANEILTSTTNITSPLVSKTDNVVQSAFTIVKEFNFSLSPYSHPGADKMIRINYRPKGCHSLRFLETDTAGSTANVIEGNLILYAMYSGVAAPTHSVNYDQLEWVDS